MALREEPVISAYVGEAGARSERFGPIKSTPRLRSGRSENESGSNRRLRPSPSLFTTGCGGCRWARALLFAPTPHFTRSAVHTDYRSVDFTALSPRLRRG